MSNSQKELERLERRKEELNVERARLAQTVATAKQNLAACQIDADNVFIEAERSGNSKQIDQALKKLDEHEAIVRRKEAALRACERDITDITNRIGEAKTPPLREKLAAVIAEADQIGRQEALSRADWQRLTELHTQGKALLYEIMRLTGKMGDTDPFCHPAFAFARYAYGLSEQCGWGIAYIERARTVYSAPSHYAALFGENGESLHDELRKRPAFSITTLLGIGAK